MRKCFASFIRDLLNLNLSNKARRNSYLKSLGEGQNIGEVTPRQY